MKGKFFHTEHTRGQWENCCNLQHPAHAAAGNNRYGGCGRGWVEFDKKQNAVKMRYGDDAAAPGQDGQDGFCGGYRRRPAVTMRKMPNGNVRIAADFSCWDALLYEDPEKLLATRH